MEFKGTQGKWVLHENEYGYYTSVRNEENTRKICTSRVNNQTHSNANLLLISKAPEMLEMLKRFVENDDLKIDIFKEAEQLIKEATEL